MKKSIITVFIILLASVFFSGCGWKQINIAKANFINAVANNPKTFKNNYNLVGHLIIGNRQTASVKGGEDITADDIRAWRRINRMLKK